MLQALLAAARSTGTVLPLGAKHGHQVCMSWSCAWSQAWTSGLHLLDAVHRPSHHRTMDLQLLWHRTLAVINSNDQAIYRH